MSKRKTRRPARDPAPASRALRTTLSPRLLAPAGIVALFLPAIFLLPYHVRPPGPSGSQSWEFGFNNTTAQELIALLLLALFAWRLFFDRFEMRETAVGKTLLEKAPAGPPRALWLTMGAYLLLTWAVLTAWYLVLPYTHYGELTYFMQRLEIMVATGRVPHRDFDFDYGSGMLALPLFIYKLWHGRLSIEAAYFTALLLHFALGFALLAYVVSQLNSKLGKGLIFFLMAFPWINLTMGLQYTPLRFTTALASIFAIRHLHRATAGTAAWRWAGLGLAAFLFPFLNFLLSPEMGLALLVALFVYFGWFILGPERRVALLLLPWLAGVALIYYGLPRAYFNSMISFGKGGASFPIFPTMHILVFLAAAIWVFPVLGVIAIRDKTSAAPFCAGLAIMLGLFILPATGRCDSGHVYINSMGLFTVAVCALGWLPPKWGYPLLGLYTLVVPAMNFVVFWNNYQQPILGALEARRQLSHLTYAQDNYASIPPGGPIPPIHYSKLLPFSGWLHELPQAKIGIPLGVDEATERYLRLTGRSAPEYHIAPYFDIFDPSTLEEKYADLRTMEYILVPQGYLRYLPPVNERAKMEAQAVADCKFMSGLLLFPVDLPAVNAMFEPNADIMRHIAEKYVVAKQYPDELLLRRKPE